MATKAQKRRADYVDARLRKAFPDYFCMFVSFDDDGWMNAYLRPVDGGAFARELFFTADQPVAQCAAVVSRWIERTAPGLIETG